MDYFYIDENNVFHQVRIHNFDRRDTSNVRVIGDITLNPKDMTYPDKKWVKVSQLFTRAKFSEEFVEKNSF